MRTSSEIYEIAAKYRGNVLGEMVWLEKLLDTYLSNYFTNGDQNLVRDMQLLVWGDNRIALDNKRQIFHYVAEHNDRQWYNSYESIRLGEKSKGVIMNKDLQYIIEERNMFAHCLVDTDKDALKRDESIVFFKFKNDVSRFEYTPEKYTELMLLILNISTHLYNRIKNRSI